ncbi:MAG: redox-regulated ATPase YchF, partial [Defluviitaleaceae bacterium]|nr:redox-regulated ATPase YchF [Defluviitaleaceae bacterium]
GNQFLSFIREVDAIVHVVRCFTDDNVPHVYPDIDPKRDVETVNLELIFADLEFIERRLVKAEKNARTDKSGLRELDVLNKLKEGLEGGVCARDIAFDNDEDATLSDGLNLLTKKPVLYAANISEDAAKSPANDPFVKKLAEFAAAEGACVFVSCAKFEAEVAMLEPEEKRMFLEEMGLAQNGLDRLISAGYELLGLISFLTAGPKEVRAWTISRGTKAAQAAGKIHSDLERGFIRAEVVPFAELDRLGSHAAAKERGLVRSEGKEYVVKDGDVVLIRFNV